MQVKSESTDLLKALKGKQASPELKVAEGLTPEVQAEFGKLLDKASGELVKKDPNENLLKMMMQEGGEGTELAKPEGMGKLINPTKPVSEEQIAQKVEAFANTKLAANDGAIPFNSHDKLTSPELAQQFKLEKDAAVKKAMNPADSADLNKILNPEALSKGTDLNQAQIKTNGEKLIVSDQSGKVELAQMAQKGKNVELSPKGNPVDAELMKSELSKPELAKQIQKDISTIKNGSSELDAVLKAESAKTANVASGETKNASLLKMSQNQSSTDFLKNLQVSNSEKVSVNTVKPEVNKQAKIHAYGKEHQAINGKMITLKSDQAIGEMNKDDAELGEMKVNNKDNILNLMEKADQRLAADRISTPRPVVDLSNISSQNKVELVNKISNYIEQANFAKSDSVDVLVRHDDLGTFQITAQKNAMKGDIVDLKINTLNENGRTFFVENEAELIRNLNQSGIKVTDLKISNGKDVLGMADMKGQSSFERSFNENSSQQGQSGAKQFSQNFSGREDSQRRRNLWQQFEQHQQAYA